MARVDSCERKSKGVLHDDILTALVDYCTFPHGQGFALMLNGPWGSGKTKFVEKNLGLLWRERPGETLAKPIVVSLYGVKEPSQIEDRLFEKLHPVLSHKATRIAGAILRGAAKAAIKVDLGSGFSASGSVPDVDLSALIRGSNGRVLIFDDFERAIMSPVEVLGFINPLVEHEDCKVIILADETQFKGSKRQLYVDRKEKTVGQTIEFRPDLATVYDAFIAGIDDKGARDFLGSSAATVQGVFADSGFENLRLLKYFLWDFERVWKVLTPDQRRHAVGMEELVSLLCAAALELRRGTLTAETFDVTRAGFLSSLFSERNQPREKVPMDLAEEKYPSVRFDSTLLTKETIVDIVLRSKVSAADIQASLSAHPHFASQHTVVSSWQALWKSYELPAAEQDAAVERFEEDFAARAFNDLGVLYHVFGLGIWLSNLGYSGWEPDVVEDKLKDYIIDVYRRAPTIEEIADHKSLDLRMGAYGLGFREDDSPVLARLVEFERAARAVWRKSGYQSVANSLRALAFEDSERFLRDVCFTHGGPSTYARIGVLRLIDPVAFATDVAQAPYHAQTKILMSLAIRYEQVTGYAELREEGTWLRDLQRTLKAEALKLPRIARSSLINLVGHYIDKALAGFEAPEATPVDELIGGQA